MKRHLILGAGIAGRRAAEAIRMKDAAAEITMVDEQQELFFTRPMLGEMFGRKAGAEKVAAGDKGWFSKYGIRFHSGVKVSEVRTQEQKVLLGTREVLSYDSLLIASGTRVERLFCDDGKTSGIVYLNGLEDVRAPGPDLGYVRRAVVYGTNYQAMGALSGLRKLGLNCTLVLPEEGFWPGVMNTAASGILKEFLQREGVEVITGAAIQMLDQEAGALRAIIVSGGKRIPADLLVVAAPQVPVLESLTQGGVKTEGGIVVNSMLGTTVENVFAAGDVARLASEPSDVDAFRAGWMRAWRQGNIAGTNMAGGQITYDAVPSVRTRVLGLDLVCLGMGGADGDGIRSESGDYPYDEMPYLYKRIVEKDGKAAGALFLGDANEASILEEWIYHGLRKEDFDKRVLNSMFQIQYQAVTAHGVLCPVCKFHMQVDDNTEEGTIITCPVCGVDFRIERLSNGAFHAMPVN